MWMNIYICIHIHLSIYLYIYIYIYAIYNIYIHQDDKEISKLALQSSAYNLYMDDIYLYIYMYIYI